MRTERLGKSFALLLAFTSALLLAARTEADEAPEDHTASNPGDVRRTWERAAVEIPLPGAALLSGRMDEGHVHMALARLPARTKLPTVIFLHGCTGLTRAGHRYVILLARSGYAVIAPDSFARTYRPKTCDPRRYRGFPGAPIRRVAEMRLEEARYAAQMAIRLPWVDRENLFLMGHSQGGATAAAYDGREFKARIVTGARCTLGVRAPSATPVLSLYSENDPWRRGRSPRGCLLRGKGRRTPIEFHLFPGKAHNFSRNRKAQQIILDFLARYTTRRS